MDYGLRGKKALITGGTHGIGSSIVLSLAQQGVSVAFLSRSDEKLQSQVDLIKPFVDISFLAIKCDVLDKKSIDQAWDFIETQWGGVDILINNVGGGGRWGKENILETSFEIWGEVFQKNAGAASRLTVLALPYMVSNKWGRVVTITSTLGSYIGGRPWFNMAKVAQSVLMKNFAKKKEFVRMGITFNSVAPGAVMIPETGWDLMEKEVPEEFKIFKEELPLGRLGEPDEVANLVTFLCSEQSSYINGSSIVVDGGESSSIT